MKGVFFGFASFHGLLAGFNAVNDQIAPFIFTAICAATFVALAVNKK